MVLGSESERGVPEMVLGCVGLFGGLFWAAWHTCWSGLRCQERYRECKKSILRGKVEILCLEVSTLRGKVKVLCFEVSLLLGVLKILQKMC